jgi:hypothetical protein
MSRLIFFVYRGPKGYTLYAKLIVLGKIHHSTFFTPKPQDRQQKDLVKFIDAENQLNVFV